MKCEECGKEHDGSYGSGRFCSENCKQKFIANKKGRSHVCRYCNKGFETSQKLGAHVRNCGQNPNARLRQKKSLQTQKELYDIKNPIIHVKLNCINCGKEYELDVRQKQFDNDAYKKCCSSSCAHSYAAKFADPEKNKSGMKTFAKVRVIHCHKCGKDVNVIGSVSIILCDECKEKTKANPSEKCLICGKDVVNGRKTCCKEHEKELRIQSFKNKVSKTHSVGGLRNKGGRGKRGWYKGIHCDSSWELAWVIYQLEHNVPFVRNTKICFYYYFNEKKYKYYPDFILQDGTFVEIKGWKSPKWEAKVEQFPSNQKLQIYYHDDLKNIFDYVIQKYGKKYTDLYE